MTTAEKPSDSPKLLQILGPGLITGAADDDPSGIATYSQVGAQFGYGLAWTLVVSYPLMAAIQEISARIGRVTGRGIAGNLRRHYSPWLLYTMVGLLIVANVLNLGADVGAMGAALKLLIGGPALLYVVGFGIASAALQIFGTYARYVSILKWLTLSLFGYVAAAFMVDARWTDVLHEVLVPPLQASSDYVMAVVAVLGTTISPYLFFWQAGQEVEDEKECPEAKPLKKAPEQAPATFTRIRIDTCIGMALSNVIAFFIIVTAAASLHAHGTTDIQTSEQAAEALRAVAGNFTFALFAAAIIGTGLLALPALAGSASYALGEALRWPVGMARRPLRAKAFYGTIAIATFLGVALNFSPIDPVKALYWSAVINGVTAAPVMAMMMALASRRDVMGEFTLPPVLKILGWLSTAVMAATVLAMGVAALL